MIRIPLRSKLANFLRWLSSVTSTDVSDQTLQNFQMKLRNKYNILQDKNWESRSSILRMGDNHCLGLASVRFRFPNRPTFINFTIALLFNYTYQVGIIQVAYHLILRNRDISGVAEGEKALSCGTPEATSIRTLFPPSTKTHC